MSRRRTVIDVTPEVVRLFVNTDAKALITWGVLHGYWFAADGTEIVMMPPSSLRQRIANKLRFMGVLPWKMMEQA